MKKKQRDVERVKLRKKFRKNKTEIYMEKDRQTQTDRRTDKQGEQGKDRLRMRRKKERKN